MPRVRPVHSTYLYMRRMVRELSSSSTVGEVRNSESRPVLWLRLPKVMH